MKNIKILLFIITFLMLTNQFSNACTGITVSSTDLTIVNARTMELGADLKSNIIVVPKGYLYKGTAPGMKPGKTWQTKYTIIGANVLGSDYCTEGMNEKGLSMGGFYHVGYADYQTVTEKDFPNTIASGEAISYVLTNFSSVDEAVMGLKEVYVANVKIPELQETIISLHYKLLDADGNCVVVEYLNGNMVVYDNPLGVITNNPTFDWHLTNLRNYVNLSPDNILQNELGTYIVKRLGQGSGMLGLPGDFTPPSRFIRAALISQFAFKPASADEAVNLAFHILNSFDIIRGVIREKNTDKSQMEQTQWVTASDLKNLRFFMRTFDNPKIKMVDLKKVDTSEGKIITYDMSGNDFYEELTVKK